MFVARNEGLSFLLTSRPSFVIVAIIVSDHLMLFTRLAG